MSLPDLHKHPTASVYILGPNRTPEHGRWKVALIRHPRFGKWMVPGGHVEDHENPAEAAIREVREETGLTIGLLPPATPSLPANVTDLAVPLPHWIVEERILGDRRPHPHVHIDHLYVAVVTATARPDEHLDLGWFSHETLADLDMFSTTRSLALALLSDPPTSGAGLPHRRARQ